MIVVAFLGLCLPGLYYVFFLHLVRIPTSSMANTVVPGDHLVIKKRAFGEISRGDIIVFSWPGNEVTKYLYRVVGLPGETIQISGKAVYINGQELAEQRVTVKTIDFQEPLEEVSSNEGAGPYRVFYLTDDDPIVNREGGDFGVQAPFQIPKDEYFVLGDNRDNSADSRNLGTVPRSQIFGKATMIYWSTSPVTDKLRSERIFTRLR